MAPPSLAELFAPPPGYIVPRDAEAAARWAAPFGRELAAALRASPRGDWSLWLLGWVEPHAPWAVRRGLPWATLAGARCVAPALAWLDEEDEETRALHARIEAWARAPEPRPVPTWPISVKRDYLASVDLAGHAAKTAVEQLAAVGLHGLGLGPAVPDLLAQLAVWPARAANGGHWDPAAASCQRSLADSADAVRETLAPVLDQVTPVRERPASWRAAGDT
jgi:hypothetical protein